MDDINEFLLQQEKGQLVALINEMIQREPKLRDMVELYRFRESQRGKPIDLGKIGQQVRKAFNLRVDRDAAGEAASNLEPILDIADDYLENHSYFNAARVYQVIVQAFSNEEEIINSDEYGDSFNDTVEDINSGLETCLQESQGDGEIREQALHVLYQLIEADTLIGGMGLEGRAESVLLTHVTLEEHQLLEAWIHETITRTTSQFIRTKLEALLVKIKG
jgi:hypothetical protein